MKTTVEIDIDDVRSGLSSVDETELAKQLAADKLDIEELIEVIHSAGYDDVDILNCLDWAKVRDFVHDRE